MKVYKLVLSFCVIAFGLFAVAWILGFINESQAQEGSARIIGAIVTFGICSGIIWLIVGSKSGKQSQNDANSAQKPGPKF